MNRFFAVLASIALAACAAANSSAQGDAAVGLCAATERALFSCVAAHGKMISVCAEPPERAQYRFGTPGHVELAYPADGRDGPKGLLYSHYSRAQVDRYTIRFMNGPAEYFVYDWSDESGRRESGVEVHIAGDEKVRNVPCVGALKLDPEATQALLACDRDSALAYCP